MDDHPWMIIMITSVTVRIAEVCVGSFSGLRRHLFLDTSLQRCHYVSTYVRTYVRACVRTLDNAVPSPFLNYLIDTAKQKAASIKCEVRIDQVRINQGFF